MPIEVRPLPGAPGGPERYQVVAGFRRLAALRLLVREVTLTPVDVPERLTRVQVLWQTGAVTAFTVPSRSPSRIASLRMRVVIKML